MLQLRSLLVLALLIVGCASTGEPTQRLVSGLLGEGGRISGQTAEGESWGLGLDGDEVQLEIAGAEVVFEDGASQGKLGFQHSPDGHYWTLALAGGPVTCRGAELQVSGQMHRLESGQSYRFDASGALVSQVPR